MYKDNLKTNTFINLKYVANEDSRPKYPEEIKSRKDKENDIILKNDMKESNAERLDNFTLNSEQKSKESFMGNTDITSKIVGNFNFSNVINSTNNSNITKLSSCFGDVAKDYMKNEIYRSIPAFPKTDNLIKSSTNEKVFKQSECSSTHCRIRQLLPESSMSLNSPDILKINQEQASDVYIDLEPVSYDSEKHANYDEKFNKKSETTCGAENETKNSDLKKISSFEGTKKVDDMNYEVYQNNNVSTLSKIDDIMRSPSDDETFKLTEYSSIQFQLRHSSSESFMSFDSLDIPKNNHEKLSDVCVNLESLPHNSEKVANYNDKLDMRIKLKCDARNETNGSNFEKISATLGGMTKDDTNNTVYHNVLTSPKVDDAMGLSSDEILKKNRHSGTSLEVLQLSDLVMSLEALEIPQNNKENVYNNYTESKSALRDGENSGDNDGELESKTELFCGAVNRINDRNLDKISRNYENVIKENIKGRVYHNVPAFPKIDNTTESALNDETFKQSRYSDTSFEIYSSLSDSLSLDSLEIPTSDQENTCYNYTELKSSSYDGEDFENNNVKLDTKIEELRRSENGTSPCRKVVHVNSVFNIKSVFERNLLNKSQSCQAFENMRTHENEKPKDDIPKIIFQNNRSDDVMPYTNSCVVKDDIDDLHFATPVKDNNVDLHFTTSVKQNTEKSRESYENKEKPTSEILMPENNVTEIQIDFRNNISNEEMNIKEELEEERGTLRNEFYFQKDKNDDMKTGDNLFSFAERLKEIETDTISINTLKSKKKTKYTFRRNDSYEKALKNGLSDLKINENSTATKRNKLNMGKRASFLNFLFLNKDISTTKKKTKIDNKVKLKNSKANVSTLINQDNHQDSQSRSSVMQECMSGDTETPSKENRRKWLKCFPCIRSK